MEDLGTDDLGVVELIVYNEWEAIFSSNATNGNEFGTDRNAA
ncbi:hypothetical protein [Spirosoma arboris]|nr:hypothetical protein [Spirosoma arboris]